MSQVALLIFFSHTSGIVYTTVAPTTLINRHFIVLSAVSINYSPLSETKGREMEKICKISGRRTEMLVNLTQGAEIIYWGNKLTLTPPERCLSLDRPVPFGRLDCDVPLTLFPDSGSGVFSSPALEGHRNGQDWSPVFTIQSVEHDEHSLRLVSHDPVARLCLLTELTIDPLSDIVAVRHTLNNESEEPFTVNRLATTLPLPMRAIECLSFYGRWVNEFQQHRHILMHGGFQQENRRGRTSHEHYPALIIGTKGFDEQHGEVWGAHLAWSGNHRMRVDVKADGRRFLQAEALYYPGEICLQKDERITTPWLYTTYCADGLNGMSHQFHQFVREHILTFPQRRNYQTCRPVHLNTWEGIYFEHDPDYIMCMATEAAKMGVERFIIDDGWFKGRCNDRAALGDWYLDKQKYPDGLQPVIEHVKAMGMEFGIWVEPEMISKDSDLYRQHPDWLMELDGYEQPTGRNQYLIDLQNPDAFAYLLERLDDLLSRYDIAYLKWDMNRETVQPAHHGQACQTRQVQNVYRLMDELKTRHPHIEIESCAAGGGRIDYEILKRVQRFWPSDNNDALKRQEIQSGFSYFFPPEVMGSHIGARHCHATRRVSDIDFRGITALFGHMGIELDPIKESDEEKAGFAKYIALHKQYRNLLHSGITYRIESDDQQAQKIHAVITPDAKHALVMVAQLDMPTYAHSGTLRIPGLIAQTQYRVNVIAHPNNFHNGLVNKQPVWSLAGIVSSGEWLRQVGLAMPILDPTTAILIDISAL